MLVDRQEHAQSSKIELLLACNWSRKLIGGSCSFRQAAVLVVLIADAAQNAMGSEYKSVTKGALLVFTIVSLDFALDWVGHGCRGCAA